MKYLKSLVISISLVLVVGFIYKSPPLTKQKTLKVIAHRGASVSAPENTLSSFSKAIELGADLIEFDVHLSQDGVPVVLHDGYLHRTTDVPYPQFVSNLTLSQIKNLDAGFWFHDTYIGESIPTLKEVLELPLATTGLMIEIKTGSATEEMLAEKVVKELQEHSMMTENNLLYIGSFSPLILHHVRHFMPNLKVIAIMENLDFLDEHAQNNPDVFVFHHSLVTEHLTEEIHKKGKEVWVFTVDDLEDANRLEGLNVDGIITNDPGSFVLNY